LFTFWQLLLPPMKERDKSMNRGERSYQLCDICPPQWHLADNRSEERSSGPRNV